MSKRVHEIAKERGLPPKEVLQRLQAAGLQVKAVSSSVDEAEARRVLGDGAGNGQSAVPAEGGRQQRAPQRSDGGGDRPQRGRGEARPDAPTARSDAPGARADAPTARPQPPADGPDGAPPSDAPARSASEGPSRRSESESGHK